MYCPKCGSVNPDSSSFCTKCGAAMSASSGATNSEKLAEVYVKQKSGGLAILLSFFITGLGEMYAGKIGKGILLLFLQIIMSIFGVFFLLPYIISVVLWIYSMYDAHKLVKIHNARLIASVR